MAAPIRTALAVHRSLLERRIWPARRCRELCSISSSATQQLETVQDKTLQHPDYFGVGDLFTTSDLFDAKVHLGHKEGLRNKYMTPYLLGNRLGVDIIDLDQTAEHLRSALNVLAHLAYRDAILLFITRSRQFSFIVEQTAKECQEFSHCRYWSGGMFTNSTLQYKSMTRLPDACVFLNTQNNVFGQHRAVSETAKTLVMSVGVVDSNCDPRLITYPIPGNDDTPSAVHLYCSLFKGAVLLGKERRKSEN